MAPLNYSPRGARTAGTGKFLPTGRLPPGVIEDELGFEKEKMSPIVPAATAILVALFVLGIAFRLVTALAF